LRCRCRFHAHAASAAGASQRDASIRQHDAAPPLQRHAAPRHCALAAAQRRAHATMPPPFIDAASANIRARHATPDARCVERRSAS